MNRTADDAGGRAVHGQAVTPDAPLEVDWHGESVLLAELATVNARVSRYITELLDADATRRAPVLAVDEVVLGRALVDLGCQVLRRATERTAAVTGAATS